jgi:hypothetical protein
MFLLSKRLNYFIIFELLKAWAKNTYKETECVRHYANVDENILLQVMWEKTVSVNVLCAVSHSPKMLSSGDVLSVCVRATNASASGSLINVCPRCILSSHLILNVYILLRVRDQVMGFFLPTIATLRRQIKNPHHLICPVMLQSRIFDIGCALKASALQGLPK